MVALFCLLGAMIAAAYTSALAWNVSLYASSATVGHGTLLHVARTAAVVAALVAFALAGGRALVAALAGFALAHAALVIALRSRT